VRAYAENIHNLKQYKHSSMDELQKKAVPLHAMEALGGKGGIAPAHS
jgi:hypothetical protein